MALAVAQTQHTTFDGDNVTSSGITTTSGSLIVVTCYGYGASSTPIASNCTDSKGNTYSLADAIGNGGAEVVAIFYAENITGGASHTVSVNLPGGAFATNIDVLEVTGAATATSLDKHVTGTGTGTNPVTSATGTLSQADEIIICVFAQDTGTNNAISPAATWSSGGSEPDGTAHMVGATAYKIVSATTTTSHTWSDASSGSYRTVIASFKAPAAAATKAPPFKVRGLQRNLMRRY